MNPMIGININEGNSCEVFIDPEDGTQAIVLGPFECAANADRQSSVPRSTGLTGSEKLAGTPWSCCSAQVASES